MFSFCKHSICFCTNLLPWLHPHWLSDSCFACCHRSRKQLQPACWQEPSSSWWWGQFGRHALWWWRWAALWNREGQEKWNATWVCEGWNATQFCSAIKSHWPSQVQCPQTEMRERSLEFYMREHSSKPTTWLSSLVVPILGHSAWHFSSFQPWDLPKPELLL